MMANFPQLLLIYLYILLKKINFCISLSLSLYLSAIYLFSYLIYLSISVSISYLSIQLANISIIYLHTYLPMYLPSNYISSGNSILMAVILLPLEMPCSINHFHNTVDQTPWATTTKPVPAHLGSLQQSPSAREVPLWMEITETFVTVLFSHCHVSSQEE